MAGGAQGGGSPAQSNPQQFQNALQNYRQGAAGMPSQVAGANMAAPGGAQMPELNPQTTSDIEKLLQYYKNQQIGGNSAAPATAPGGTTPGMYAGGPVGYANGGPMAPPRTGGVMPMAPQTGGVLPMAPQTGGVMPMAPQPAPVPVNPQAALRAQAPVPMAQDPRFMQNPGMTPRMVAPQRPIMPQGRPQIQGNPNAMPMQRFGRRGR